MRISDWSSDVCSSDLPVVVRRVENLLGDRFAPGGAVRRLAVDDLADDGHDPDRAARFTGRIGGDPVVERDRLEIPWLVVVIGSADLCDALAEGHEAVRKRVVQGKWV